MVHLLSTGSLSYTPWRRDTCTSGYSAGRWFVGSSSGSDFQWFRDRSRTGKVYGRGSGKCCISSSSYGSAKRNRADHREGTTTCPRTVRAAGEAETAGWTGVSSGGRRTGLVGRGSRTGEERSSSSLGEVSSLATTWSRSLTSR